MGGVHGERLPMGDGLCEADKNARSSETTTNLRLLADALIDESTGLWIVGDHVAAPAVARRT
jgi:hypothetical protein